MDRNRRSHLGTLAFLLFFVLCAYLLFQIATTWVGIGQRQQELEAVSARLAEQQAKNDELNRTLDAGADKIVEQVARDELGYAKPNERVFVDTGGA